MIHAAQSRTSSSRPAVIALLTAVSEVLDGRIVRPIPTLPSPAWYRSTRVSRGHGKEDRIRAARCGRRPPAGRRAYGGRRPPGGGHLPWIQGLQGLGHVPPLGRAPRAGGSLRGLVQ